MDNRELYEHQIKELRDRRDAWRNAYLREVQISNSLMAITYSMRQLLDRTEYDLSGTLTHFAEIERLRNENAASTQDAIENDELVDAMMDFALEALESKRPRHDDGG